MNSVVGKPCSLIKLLDFGITVTVLNLSGWPDHCSQSPNMFMVFNTLILSGLKKY